MGNPFRPRRMRLVFEDGRVVGVRPASDPWWETRWLADDGVIAFFREQDAACGRVRLAEFEPGAEDAVERRAAARHARAARRAAAWPR